MKTYHLTSNAFDGFVELIYDDLGLLISSDQRHANLSYEQQIWLLQSMPTNLERLQKLLNSSEKGAKVTELKQVITFEDFYRRYGNKVGKKEAQRKWERMSKAEQIKAYNFIPKYLQNLTVAMMYPATYLNAERWND